MQILPVSHTDDLSVSSGLNTHDLLDFNRLLSESLTNTPAEITPLLDAVSDTAGSQAALLNENYDAQNTAHTTDAPYTTTDINSSPPASSTLTDSSVDFDELRLTDDELQTVVQNLRDQGMDADTIARVEALAGYPGGVSMRQVIQAVAGTEAAQLTDGDLLRIETFANKLDPTGQLGESLLNDLKDGRVVNAWNTLSATINKTSDAITVDAATLLSLGKALRLDNAELEKLQSAFSNTSKLTLNQNALNALLSPIQKHMNTLEANQQQMADKLSQALSSVVESTRQRMEDANNAAALSNKRIEQTLELMNDTFLDKFGPTKQTEQNLQNIQNAQAAQTQQTLNQSQIQGFADAQKKEQLAQLGTTEAQRNAKAQETENRITDLFSVTEEQQAEQDTTFTQGDSLFDHQNSGEQSLDKTWQTLLDKLEVRHNSSQSSPIVSSVIGQTTQTTAQAVNTTPQQPTGSGNTAVNQRILAQVQEGFFTSLNNGGKQLTLNLAPEHLGMISLVLSTRNGEVSAILKPENAETAALLNQQMEQLKHNLEQQGLKVDALEVQTPSNNNAKSWQGMEQHNQAQEQFSRQQSLERARRLNLLHAADIATANISSTTFVPLRDSAQYISIMA